jgi:hypothetical protein
MAEQSELLTATDETIDDAVKYADPMVLRGLLYQLTGDESIAATEVATTTIRNVEISSVSNPLDVALIQSKAAAFLKSYRDQGARNPLRSAGASPPQPQPCRWNRSSGVRVRIVAGAIGPGPVGAGPRLARAATRARSTEIHRGRDRRWHGRSERRRSNETCRHPILCNRKER